MEQDEVRGDGDGHVMMMMMLRNWKQRKRKTKWAQGKGIFDRAILFCHSRHRIEDVSEFRIDSHTIKRGNLDANTVIYLKSTHTHLVS